MKTGEYVRTKNGIIGKIKLIDNQTDLEDLYLVKRKWYYKEYFIKSSPNIIDLIEVGDYVNGQKVFDKLYDELNKCWYLKLEIGEVFGKYARTYQQHIKSIVTKEAFESMEYKIGE